LPTASRSKRAKRGQRGFDGGKKVKGRKRHLQVDTLGLLWGRVVTAANVSDPAGFRLVFASALLLLMSVVTVFADSGYRGTLLDWVVSVTGGHATLQIVRPAPGRVGFGVDPKRWIVERTISWLNWSRRLSKDYEQTPSSAQACGLT
jgi:transposase